jgi:hypothetical protein
VSAGALPVIVAVRYEERDGRRFKVSVLADAPPRADSEQGTTPQNSRGAPHLDNVLRTVNPGRRIRLYLSPEQRAATSDRDGLILRRVVRALVQARDAASNDPPYSFPLTEECFCAVARKIGCPVGGKRARRLIRRGIVCGLLLHSGSYRTPYKRGGDGGGHRVRLYKLGCRIVGLRSALCTKPAVGKTQLVKPSEAPASPEWWLDGLMGTADGLPPPQAQGSSFQAKRLRRWRPRSEAAVGCP